MGGLGAGKDTRFECTVRLRGAVGRPRASALRDAGARQYIGDSNSNDNAARH